MNTREANYHSHNDATPDYSRDASDSRACAVSGLRRKLNLHSPQSYVARRACVPSAEPMCMMEGI